MKKIYLLTLLMLLSINTFAQRQATAQQSDDPSDYWDMRRSNYSLDGGQSTTYRISLTAKQVAAIAISTEDRYAQMEYTITRANGSIMASGFCTGDTYLFESSRTEEYTLKIENTGDTKGYFTVVLYTSKKKVRD